MRWWCVASGLPADGSQSGDGIWCPAPSLQHRSSAATPGTAKSSSPRRAAPGSSQASSINAMRANKVPALPYPVATCRMSCCLFCIEYCSSKEATRGEGAGCSEILPSLCDPTGPTNRLYFCSDIFFALVRRSYSPGRRSQARATGVIGSSCEPCHHRLSCNYFFNPGSQGEGSSRRPVFVSCCPFIHLSSSMRGVCSTCKR